MRARGLRPSSLAFFADIMMTAAAPAPPPLFAQHWAWENRGIVSQSKVISGMHDWHGGRLAPIGVPVDGVPRGFDSAQRTFLVGLGCLVSDCNFVTYPQCLKSAIVDT